MDLSIKGEVAQILPIESGTTKNGDAWEKQTIIIKVKNGNYEDNVAVTFFNKVDKLTHVKVGQTVKAMLNLKSREWNGKWFNDINGWDINNYDGPETEGQGRHRNDDNYEDPPPANDASGDDEYENDLPF